MLKNETFISDLDSVISEKNIDFNMLENKTILVTGATGLIAYTLIHSLLYARRNIKVLALVRNLEKAKKMYGEQDGIMYIVSDICDAIAYDDSIDFIVHGASITSSKSFVDCPIYTIFTAINGTKNILNLAVEKNVKSFVYLSSMEVYGTPNTDEKIHEINATNIDTMETRSSYPESKRMCESICRAYFAEKNVPSKTLRLTQTFGPGVDYNDGRVFAEFARCAIEKRDIILKTKGETKRSYLYTADATRAILIALLKGENGHAYNVANEDTYCSIYEMAQLVAQEFTDGEIQVQIEDNEDISKLGYASTMNMNLDTGKLQSLGWEPSSGLVCMFENMCKTMEKI
ncbi:MAG: NAD(P)-dependent oxidoreductase [Bacillota bacterium]